MRPIPSLLALVALVFLTACSTPDSRIERSRSAFAEYPADAQEKIRAGQVDVGFTEEMVLMALGKPTRVFTRKTESGDTEVWGYNDNTPRVSFGFGFGTGGRRSAVGGGVSMSTGGYDPEEKVRVEFRDGLVTAVDYLRK